MSLKYDIASLLTDLDPDAQPQRCYDPALLRRARAAIADLEAQLTAARQDADRLAALVEWIKPYVQLTYDEECGEEAAEAKRDLAKIDAALSEHAKLSGWQDFPKTEASHAD